MGEGRTMKTRLDVIDYEVSFKHQAEHAAREEKREACEETLRLCEEYGTEFECECGQH